MSAESGEDEDFSCHQVASKVAQVTLESDSLPESSETIKVRRKKRTMRRPRDFKMDVDPAKANNCRKSTNENKMEWEGGLTVPRFQEDESALESDSSISSKSSCGKEADDEQSDWVGYSSVCIQRCHPYVNRPSVSSVESAPVERRSRYLKRPHHTSIQRKLDRHIKEANTSGKSTESSRGKEASGSSPLERLLQSSKIEAVKRSRASLIARQNAN